MNIPNRASLPTISGARFFLRLPCSLMAERLSAGEQKISGKSKPRKSHRNSSAFLKKFT